MASLRTRHCRQMTRKRFITHCDNWLKILNGKVERLQSHIKQQSPLDINDMNGDTTQKAKLLLIKHVAVWFPFF